MSSKELSADTPSAKKFKRVYGRRQSRPLNTSRKEAVDALLPVLSIPEELLTEEGNLNPETLFSTSKPETWLEIGFGNGEFLHALLNRHKDVNFIGVEPFVNGMAAFLKSINDEREMNNIRVLMDDAMILAESLEAESLERIYVLNPDPWPKTRHHKRRIINQDNLDQFSRILKPGGLLTMATDVDDLAEWMVTQVSIHPDFTWTARSKSDWETPPAGWPLITRYATKGLNAGRTQRYLVFERK